jgi:hypothetical protein
MHATRLQGRYQYGKWPKLKGNDRFEKHSSKATHGPGARVGQSASKETCVDPPEFSVVRARRRKRPLHRLLAFRKSVDDECLYEQPFVMTLKDPDRMIANWARVVNNVDAPTDKRAAGFHP